MKTTIVAATSISVLAGVAFAAGLQPLKVRTGLWQMTESVIWSGLPPQFQAMNIAAHNYQSCVRPEDLRSNPWAEGSNGKCQWTVVNSTGSDMEVRGSACDFGKQLGMTTEVRGRIHVLDSENGTGSFDITMVGNGQTVHGQASYRGKWVGATCPAQ